MRKKLITVMTTACMVVGLLLPMITSNETKVHAQTTLLPTKNIMLGLTGLKGGQASNVYMGTYPQSEITDLTGKTENVDYVKWTYSAGNGGDDHYFGIEPIKWRVLDGAAGLLVSDTAIDGRNFDDSSNAWIGSDIEKWLNGKNTGHGATGAKGFKGYAFTTEEQATLNNDGIFLLSKDEANKNEYFLDNDARKAMNSKYAMGRINSSGSTIGFEESNWWLRSPGLDNDLAVIVTANGAVNTFGSTVYNNYGVRPALNLNPNSVLFTSAAAGGKSTSTVGAGEMSQISEYTGTDWKVTVKDTARNTFTASTKSNTTLSPSGGKINVKWDNAITNTTNNEYISYMITDSSNTEALYYGSFLNNSTSGSQDITIPANLTAGNYNLRVFNEQKNGDNYTDYASEFKDIAFTVSNPIPAKPTVTSLTTNSNPASLAGTIEVTFSEEMNTTKGSVKLGVDTLHAGTWSNGNKTYTVAYAGLLNSTEYIVNVSSFESKLGGVMDESAHKFTTIAANTPVMKSDTSNHDFGEVTLDSTLTKTITVSSTDLTGPIAYEVVGVNASDFTITKGSGYSEISGGTLNITFKPTKAGKHTATLKLTSTGATPITIELSGVGKTMESENTSTPTSPKTGDSNNTTLFLGLLVLSGIIVVGIKRRKALNK